MIIRLGELRVKLTTHCEAIAAYWSTVFAGAYEIDGNADITLTAQLSDALPPLPAHAPFFQDHHDILAAYAMDGATLLHFYAGGIVLVPNDSDRIDLTLTADAITAGALEDMVMAGLAPLLRRRGCFLVHAAGVSKHGKGVIFVGQSHSGKTTTALNLALNGWELLSNDVILVMPSEAGMMAYPVPDVVTFRPKTLTLLPQLPHEKIGRQFVPNIPLANNILPASQIISHWSSPVVIAALCFSQIGNRPTTLIKPLMQAMALSIILQESMDVWDSETLAQQTDLLTQLCLSVPCYRVALGTDLADHSDHFERLIIA
jgi:hypothetical protein